MPKLASAGTADQPTVVVAGVTNSASRRTVLSVAQQGENDMTAENKYHGQDLRGKSFRGAKLDGADFTAADVRGADFSTASLAEADFTNARIGVRPLTALVILFVALVVSIAAGVAIGLLAETVRL